MALRRGSFLDRSAAITSSCAMRQSNGAAGVAGSEESAEFKSRFTLNLKLELFLGGRSSLDVLGQLTLKKWLLPHRILSPLRKFVSDVTYTSAICLKM